MEMIKSLKAYTSERTARNQHYWYSVLHFLRGRKRSCCRKCLWHWCLSDGKEQHFINLLWDIKNPKWPSFLMEKAKYFRVWTEAPFTSEQTNWLRVRVCVRARVCAHVFQRDILCFSSIIIPLNIYYWNVNSAENWGLCVGKNRPSPTPGVVAQWNIHVPFGETKGFSYINKSLCWIVKVGRKKEQKPAGCWLNYFLATCELKFCRSSNKQQY